MTYDSNAYEKPIIVAVFVSLQDGEFKRKRGTLAQF